MTTSADTADRDHYSSLHANPCYHSSDGPFSGRPISPRSGSLSGRRARQIPEDQRELDKVLRQKIRYTPDENVFGFAIGARYLGSSSELKNPVFDVATIVQNIFKRLFISEENMTVMTDYSERDLKPTRDNILREIDNLVRKANNRARELREAGSDKKVTIVFTLAGHGGQQRDRDGDESDGYDETFITTDHQHILDDEFYDHFSRALDPAVRSLIVMDTCHSGTGFDLPFLHERGGDIRVVNRVGDWQNLANIVMISGCADDGTSSDGDENGALTAAVIETLEQYQFHLTIRQLVAGVREWLGDHHHRQRPQLTTGQEHIDLNSLLFSNAKAQVLPDAGGSSSSSSSSSSSGSRSPGEVRRRVKKYRKKKQRRRERGQRDTPPLLHSSLITEDYRVKYGVEHFSGSSSS